VDYISAGDIEKYSYCPLSWWLSRNERNKNSEGVRKHREIGKKIEELRGERRKIKAWESMIMYYSLAASIIALLGFAFFYFLRHHLFHFCGDFCSSTKLSDGLSS